MKFKQYDIWSADLNPVRGTEPGKIRPVLIVQSNLLNHHHPSTIICPITSQIIQGVEVLRTHISSNDSGLDRPSDVMIDQVRAIDNRRLIKRLGSIKDEEKLAIQKNLRVVLDL